MIKKRECPFTSAIILAGGESKRMGRQKQYIHLGSKFMIEWSVDAFKDISDEIILVLSGENFKKSGKIFQKIKKIKFAEAGPTRIKSLKNGFKKLSPKAALIAVHDGARPLVTSKIIEDCLKAALKHGASAPAVKLKDTVKKTEKGYFIQTPDRNSLLAVQTPQCYTRKIFDKIFEIEFDKDYSDESQILEKFNIKVKAVESDYSNIKITTPDDIAVAEALMRLKQQKTKKNKPRRIRFGFGYDIHRMVAGKPFVIAGEKIKHKKGMLGHSDGDLVIHAICDALLGSIAAGEIGVYFPPTDLTIMGISSRVIAEKVLEILKKRKAEIIQIDATIVAEEPRIKPHYEAMRKNVAEIFKMDISDVSVKAKSKEGLGDIGHGNAISCYAVASVEA